jgi:hypothetical protein
VPGVAGARCRVTMLAALLAGVPDEAAGGRRVHARLLRRGTRQRYLEADHPRAPPGAGRRRDHPRRTPGPDAAGRRGRGQTRPTTR